MVTIQARGRAAVCRGILFDKDGTLLDFLDLWGSWAETLTGLVERKLTGIGAMRPFDKTVLLGLRLDEANRVTGYDKTGPLAMGTEEEVTALLASTLYAAGIPWNEATGMVRELNAAALAELKQRRQARPLPGLREFLRACRQAGLPLGVVTSDTTTDTLEHLQWMGIRGEFGSVVGRDRVERGKPEPDMALLACRELGILPEEAVVIGDSNADMQMGKRAGACLTIGMAESESGKPEGASYLRDADVIVTGYRELTIHR
ncbi:HAD family hydrolase [Paenibacillus macerans]|uniref:HAD family hydrolase n=1 Tax=Paenibacillus macerans TaxID=44252 RepID=UPI003D31EFCA